MSSKWDSKDFSILKIEKLYTTYVAEVIPVVLHDDPRNLGTDRWQFFGSALVPVFSRSLLVSSNLEPSRKRMKVPKKFSHPESRRKISKLMVTELFY